MSSASLPPRQSSSQRRPSSEQDPSVAHSPPGASPSLARTDESEPLVLQEPHDPKDSPDDSQKHEQTPSSNTSDSREDSGVRDAEAVLRESTADDVDVKKCWICFADATEDTPETSPWRDPCPCALVAHEECLLDWIADMEAPNRSGNRPNRGRIECPQCKTEIKLQRPRSLLVDTLRGMEQISARLVTPSALSVLFGTLYQGSVAWGIHSIYAVFGAEDGFRLLEPILINRVRPPINLGAATAQDVVRTVLGTFVDHLVHWRLYIGLPLITPILVLSRTNSADTLLPTLPIVFFASQAHSNGDILQVGRWPPTAPFAFAMLPYVRAIYNYYYMIAWGRREQRWLREIQPRAGREEEEDNANAAENNVAEGEEGNLFEIRIDGWEEWDDEDQEILLDEAERVELERLEREVQLEVQEERRQQEQALGNPPEDPVEIAAEAQPPADQAVQPAQPPAAAAAENAAARAGGGDDIIARERRLSFSPTAIAETVIGALLFPTIAGFSGDLLKFALPRSWTSSAASGAVRKGFLQERWGRTIVGGCLFVVLKDAVMLYVRWKMAQMHRQRRVLDFDRSKAGTNRR